MGVAAHWAHPAAKPPFDASIYATRGPYDRVKFMAGFDATLEAKSLVTEKILVDRKGKPLVEKKDNPTPRLVHKWQMMHPVEESGHGAGLAYCEPVKVALQADGALLVTEHDGDRFIVNALGNIPNFDADKRGAAAGGPAPDAYTKALGTANSYFGRGYVQLTWWDGYLRAGKKLGLGTQLLTDPAQVQTADTAYKIMSFGMRTGAVFANGFTFGDFFTGTGTDDVQARKMVKGTNRNHEIASIARHYEALLLASKPAAASKP